MRDPGHHNESRLLRRGVRCPTSKFVTIGHMKLTGLLTRNQEPLPGITGVARVDRRTRELLRRISPGDIVVLDQLDLDRATADALVEAEVAGVVNASPSISGRYPNMGPELLVAAGIPLVDSVGGELLRSIKDGTKLRLLEGVVYVGERQGAPGTGAHPPRGA